MVRHIVPPKDWKNVLPMPAGITMKPTAVPKEAEKQASPAGTAVIQG
jgi:hypothetical protein